MLRLQSCKKRGTRTPYHLGCKAPKGVYSSVPQLPISWLGIIALATREDGVSAEENQKWSPKETEILSSIKGISKDLANRFIAEIGDIKKFSSAKKIIKYAGLDPVIKQSGKWRNYKGISKKGNPYLRDICYQMAHGVVTWNSVFREYLKKKRSQYGSYRKAMIAVVNKLIRVIFAMLRKGEKFRPELVAPSTRLNNFEVICYG